MRIWNMGAGENIERRGLSGEIRGKGVCVGERRSLPGVVAALLNRGPCASGRAGAAGSTFPLAAGVASGARISRASRGFASAAGGFANGGDANGINFPTPRYVCKQNICPLLLACHLPQGRREFWG